MADPSGAEPERDDRKLSRSDLLFPGSPEFFSIPKPGDEEGASHRLTRTEFVSAAAAGGSVLWGATFAIEQLLSGGTPGPTGPRGLTGPTGPTGHHGPTGHR